MREVWSPTSFPGLFSAEERKALPLLGGEKPWERGCVVSTQLFLLSILSVCLFFSDSA